MIIHAEEGKDNSYEGSQSPRQQTKTNCNIEEMNTSKNIHIKSTSLPRPTQNDIEAVFSFAKVFALQTYNLSLLVPISGILKKFRFRTLIRMRKKVQQKVPKPNIHNSAITFMSQFLLFLNKPCSNQHHTIFQCICDSF